MNRPIVIALLLGLLNGTCSLSYAEDLQYSINVEDTIYLQYRLNGLYAIQGDEQIRVGLFRSDLSDTLAEVPGAQQLYHKARNENRLANGLMFGTLLFLLTAAPGPDFEDETMVFLGGMSAALYFQIGAQNKLNKSIWMYNVGISSAK
jgi:hypothetical protein